MNNFQLLQIPLPFKGSARATLPENSSEAYSEMS